MNVELRNCSELSQPEIRRVLSAELSAHLAEERSADVTRVIIECKGPRAVLRVGDPLSRKVVQRTIDLGAYEPKARGRLLALATAELVVASWAELESNPNPKVEPAGPPPPAGVRAAARRVVRARVRWVDRSSASAAPAPSALPPAERPPPDTPRRWDSVTQYDERWPDPHNWGIDDPSPHRAFRIIGVFSVRSFFTHSGALWGGGLRVAEERFKTVGWTLDALAESGEITTSSARFQVYTATLGGGINLYRRWHWIAARAGAGVRMGLAGADSNNEQEGTSSALTPWGWPLGSIGLSVYTPRGVVLELMGEAGYVVLPVTAGTPVLRGPWFSIQLGIGIIP